MDNELLLKDTMIVYGILILIHVCTKFWLNKDEDDKNKENKEDKKDNDDEIKLKVL